VNFFLLYKVFFRRSIRIEIFSELTKKERYDIFSGENIWLLVFLLQFFFER
jgi:hypothetical protein